MIGDTGWVNAPMVASVSCLFDRLAEATVKLDVVGVAADGAGLA